ncbi:MAG: NUDIX domain-containing protein [Sporichthyaceae bacterium]
MTGRSTKHHDGDGWVECAQGHRHWGRFGAAGLLLHRQGQSETEVLLQHRAGWSHHGGTWGLLGGARHHEEPPVATALREAAEEAGLPPEAALASGQYDDDHGGWSYSTVVAAEVGDTEPRPTSAETVEVTWWPVSSLPDVPLHPGFAQTWPVVRAAIKPLTIVVDAANVVGSRPDGWWKDRAGAARRLIEDVATVCSVGVADAALPESLARPPLQHWWPTAVVVVEGAATPAAQPSSGEGPSGRMRVVAAAGSGDDAIVAAVAAAGDCPVVVVTADRELRARCGGFGATPVGPGWLLGLT